MFEVKRRQTRLRAAGRTLDLIYHNTVRLVRRGHANALIGLIGNVVQTMVFIAVFYALSHVLGMRAMAIRGDYILYLMTGIFTYMTNTKAMGAVSGAEGPASAMMQHMPMTTAIAIGSAALSALYTQVLSMLVILGVYHLAVAPVEIYDPIGMAAMVLLAWFSGCCIGLVVLSLKPWAPGLTGVASSVYSRANLVFSGKMFVANSLGYHMLIFFDWNPLFHIIDQMRGFAFINYNPHNTTITYPIYVSLVLLMLGLMGEFYGRRRISISWFAGK